MRDMFKDREHLFRMAMLFLGALGVFLVVRAALVPDGFGELGHYRTAAIDDAKARSISYAGRQACETACHAPVVEARKGSKHATIGCESCHGPLAKHAADKSIKPDRPDKRDICLRCHIAEAAKPTAFPQVDPKEHGGEGGCDECHNAHRPEIG